MISFMDRPLYLRGKSPRFSLGRRLGGPRYRSGRGGEEKKQRLFAPVRNQTPVVQPVAELLRRPFVNLVHWRQCVVIMQEEA
jgi:hypothetical protein